MTKADRAKMEERLERYRFPSYSTAWAFIDEIFDAVESEVDRAVRSERKAWRDAEELRSASLRRADENLINGMKRVGKKRIR